MMISYTAAALLDTLFGQAEPRHIAFEMEDLGVIWWSPSLAMAQTRVRLHQPLRLVRGGDVTAGPTRPTISV